MPSATAAADCRIPALVVKTGRDPIHSGEVAVLRTLGRLGVPVYTLAEDRLTPAALSRYCRRVFDWRPTGTENAQQLTDRLLGIGQRLRQRSVLIPTDDEAAILIAEHSAELFEYFLFPPVPPQLPRMLASKWGLYELCQKNGIPAPTTVRPSTVADLALFAANATFPVVVKNAEPWVRRRSPAVRSTTVLHRPEDLLALVGPGGEMPSIVLQEYIPREHAEDWIVHLYCDAHSDCLVIFTGIKVRSWPPHAGVTACAYSAARPRLAQLTERFCKQIGFHGIGDLDWRLDRRDGQYKLVDFNPRVGNQFRLFETEAGLDVIRAMHLDLTGEIVPVSRPVEGRRIIVEHFDLPARLAYRGIRPGCDTGRSSSTELAWLALDDPLPFLAMWPRAAMLVAARAVRSRRSRPAAPGAGPGIAHHDLASPTAGHRRARGSESAPSAERAARSR